MFTGTRPCIHLFVFALLCFFLCLFFVCFFTIEPLPTRITVPTRPHHITAPASRERISINRTSGFDLSLSPFWAAAPGGQCPVNYRRPRKYEIGCFKYDINFLNVKHLSRVNIYRFFNIGFCGLPPFNTHPDFQTFSSPSQAMEINPALLSFYYL